MNQTHAKPPALEAADSPVAADTGWEGFHRRWSRLKPPLRANSEVVDAVGRAVAHCRDHVLLLGVTPELADVGAQTTAVDWSPTMIARIWPGDTPARRAVLADWCTMSFEGRRFTAAIGDGSLNSVAFGDWAPVFARLESVLRPGARLAVRMYETPDPCPSVAAVHREAMAGRIGGFHAFKWHLAMAIAAERDDPAVPVALIHRIFEREFPDRAALARATGWSEEEIAEIDAYRGQDTVYCFPPRRRIAAAMPSAFRNVQFLVSGTYELAERCPILVADFAP